MILLTCPNCGPRNLSEFRYGGEARPRPKPAASNRVWTDYIYVRSNPLGNLREWWFHRRGCRRWFLAERHTKTHHVQRTEFWGDGP